MVFAGGPNLAHASEGMAAVVDTLGPDAAVGCGAQGVVGEAREVELGGVAVWAASLGSGVAEPFALEATPGEAGSLAISGVPDLDRADALILLVDPFSFPVEPLLGTLAQAHPGLPVVGGLASARDDSGALLDASGPVAAGAVGLALSGVRVAACVSQGARPVGPEMAITAGEANVIHELAGKPAIARLQEAVTNLSPAERGDGGPGSAAGPGRGPEQARLRARRLPRARHSVRRCRVRRNHGRRADPGWPSGAPAGARQNYADEDLTAVVKRGVAELGTPPAGALLFHHLPNGRGSHMFSTPDHDAQVLDGTTGAPAAGFFCAGEIGPVGDRNFVHGFTATMALLAPAME